MKKIIFRWANSDQEIPEPIQEWFDKVDEDFVEETYFALVEGEEEWTKNRSI